MKRFDYLCLLYSVALLVFGFDDNTPSAKSKAAKLDDKAHVETIAYHQPAIAEHVSTHRVLLTTEPTLKPIRFTK